MPDDFSTGLCAADEICLDVTVQDTDFDIAFTNVNFGAFDIETGKLCFPADSSGLYEIIMSVGDDCDNTVTDTTYVTVTINEPPLVDAGDDFTSFLCEPGEVCADVLISDPEGNLTVTTSLGTYDAETGKVCFLPEAPGQYELIVSVTDDCEVTRRRHRAYRRVVQYGAGGQRPEGYDDLPLFAASHLSPG